MKRSFSVLSILALIIAVVIGAQSCQKKSITVRKGILNMAKLETDYTMALENGAHIPVKSKIRDESADAYSNASAKLGRVLFYDKHLSINNNISCGSCHIQSKAFADGQKASLGFARETTPRNSMAILNVADNNNMFWDSRNSSPFDMATKPVFNHLEMGMENAEMLEEKLKTVSYYPELFKQAFGSEDITEFKIAKAITHFISSIYSKNSKFDHEQKNNFQGFTPLEKHGKALFESNRLQCNSCHNISSNFAAPDFPGGAYGSPSGGIIHPGTPKNPPQRGSEDPRGTTNIGLDLVYQDQGFKSGQFKIPSLRNIALTGPYMHDGRFATLSEVIDHYSHGIKNHPNLDPKFRFNGQAIKMNITEDEKTALIAFLNTLTDLHLLTDTRYSDPFEYK